MECNSAVPHASSISSAPTLRIPDQLRSSSGPSCNSFVRMAFTIGDDQLREGLQRLRDYIARGG